MKKSTSNSQDKNRNRNKTDKDTTTPNNVPKESTASKCRAVNSCSSTNKTVQEIERYTKEAENLVEALSALTRLAEQLKPCIAAKSQCSRIESYPSDVSSNEEGKQESDEPDSETSIPDEEPEEPKVVSKVRSEPARIRPEERTDHCVCCCSSLSKAAEKQPNKLTFEDDKKKKNKKDKDNDDEKLGCCHKKKSKGNNEIIELKPLPMPSMTVVYPEAEPKRQFLRPFLQGNDAQDPLDIQPDKLTIYPTVPATTTKEAMNLVDKEMQTDGACAKCEMGCNTNPVQITNMAGKEECGVCCHEDCGHDENQDVRTRPAITLNTVPFDEYTEKDFDPYRYNGIQCNCSTSKPPSNPSPPKPQNIPDQQNSPPEQQQQQTYPQMPPPSSMMECYPYYNRNQPIPYNDGPGSQYQHFPHQMTQPNPDEYTDYRTMKPTPQRPMYSDSVPIGISNANFEPPEGIVYKACITKGSAMDPQNNQGFEGIDCIPSCLSTETSNRVYGKVQSNTSNDPQPDYRYQNNVPNPNKKAVQYQDQPQYDYYKPQPQQQQERYPNNTNAPCQYEQIPQKMNPRTQESYPNNQNMYPQQPGMPRDVYEKQLNNFVGPHYNTLFVGKADKDTQQSMKTSKPPPRNTAKPDECSGSCKYKNQKK